MDGLSKESKLTLQGLASVATIVMGLGMHASLLLALLAELLFVVPRFAGMYEGFGTSLPWASQLAISVAMSVSARWPLVAVVAVLFLPVDGAVMVLLSRRDSKLPLRAWSLCLGVLMGLLIVGLFAAIYLPLPRLADTI